MEPRDSQEPFPQLQNQGCQSRRQSQRELDRQQGRGQFHRDRHRGSELIPYPDFNQRAIGGQVLEDYGIAAEPWHAGDDVRFDGRAFAFAAATGIFFDYYPAHKAAMLRPVEALRMNKPTRSIPRGHFL